MIPDIFEWKGERCAVELLLEDKKTFDVFSLEVGVKAGCVELTCYEG